MRHRSLALVSTLARTCLSFMPAAAQDKLPATMK